MFFVTSSYLSFGVVVYKWCGKWVTTPSLGSAGPTLKKVSYGIGLVGIIITGCLYVLRTLIHLQRPMITTRLSRYTLPRSMFSSGFCANRFTCSPTLLCTGQPGFQVQLAYPSLPSSLLLLYRSSTISWVSLVAWGLLLSPSSCLHGCGFLTIRIGALHLWSRLACTTCIVSGC